MTGRWVGLSYDGLVTGWATMAKTEAGARELMDELRGKKGCGIRMTAEFCEVIITADSAEWLAEFTRSLVENKLVAAGHDIATVRSIYRWQAKIEDRSQTRVAPHTHAATVSCTSGTGASTRAPSATSEHSGPGGRIAPDAARPTRQERMRCRLTE